MKEKVSKIIRYGNYISTIAETKCKILDIENKKYLGEENDSLCKACCNGNCQRGEQRCLGMHLDGAHEAEYGNGGYMYCCGPGFFFMAHTICDNMEYAQICFVTGPFVLEESKPDFNLCEKCRDIDLHNIVAISRQKAKSMFEIIGAVAKKLSDIAELETCETVIGEYTNCCNTNNNAEIMADAKCFVKLEHRDVVRKTTAYINQNYQKKITLDNLAKETYLSKTYLSRIIKEELGISFVDYLNQTRIEKSKVLLLNPKLSLMDIASEVGFQEQSYFTKVFKKIVGMPPRKYRNLNRIDSHN